MSDESESASSGDGLSRRRLLIAAATGAAGVASARVFGRAHGRSLKSAAPTPRGSRERATPSPSESVLADQSRRWSDDRTWRGHRPGPNDVATIDGPVLLDVDASVAGVEITPSGSLIFDPGSSRTLQSRQNVVVRGTLAMRPSGDRIVHRLLITGANEEQSVGGGMDVLETDIGLWLVGGGTLKAIGTAKLAWARAKGTVASGARTLTLDADPVGWRSGDEIAILPTLPPSNRGHHAAYDIATIRSVQGRSVSLTGAVRYGHPSVRVGTLLYGAEVLNLTRNVRIEGRPGRRIHVFAHAGQRQDIRWTEIRYAGPRHGPGEPVKGRYGLHFHVEADTTRRSLVEGVVVRDAGNHAFVPHHSNGITFRDCIAHNVMEEAYWWDPGEGNGSHDVVYERCVASLVRTDPDDRGFRLGAFWLGHGTGNIARGCVAAGVSGSKSSSGFVWPENPVGGGGGIKAGPNDEGGVWTFNGCVAHNNRVNGIFVWQNNQRHTLIDDFTGYYNGNAGVEHGAYENVYRYQNSRLYGNGAAALILHAVAGKGAPSLGFAGVTLDGAGLNDYLVRFEKHSLEAAQPTTFRDCMFRGSRRAAIAILEPVRNPDVLDLIDCTFDGNELWIASGVLPTTLVRFEDPAHGSIAVRRADQQGTYRAAWNARVTSISPFA